MKYPPEIRNAWRTRAECLGMNHNPFFADLEERSLRKALAICEQCPVRTPCLEDALSYGSQSQYGVRGGTTPKQRMGMLRRRGRVRAGRPPQHGTTTSYRNRGCRCTACTQAQADYMRRRRNRIKGRDVPDHVHGENGYRNYGCRCDECRTAAREAGLRRRVKERQSV